MQKEGNKYDKVLKEIAEQVFLPLIEQQLGISIKTFVAVQVKFQRTLEREVDFLY